MFPACSFFGTQEGAKHIMAGGLLTKAQTQDTIPFDSSPRRQVDPEELDLHLMTTTVT